MKRFTTKRRGRRIADCDEASPLYESYYFIAGFSSKGSAPITVGM